VTADPLTQALKDYLKREVEARVEALQTLAEWSIEALKAVLEPLQLPPNDTATAT